MRFCLFKKTQLLMFVTSWVFVTFLSILSVLSVFLDNFINLFLKNKWN